MGVTSKATLNALNGLKKRLNLEVIAPASPSGGSDEQPGKPRRKQEDRSRDARQKLLTATINVLRTRGYAGLTTKEVAKCAGMSNGALMHHYATKAELVVAATAAVYEACIERGQQVAKSPEASERPIEGFITDCLSVYFDWPFLAALEILVVARTDAVLMERILPVMEHYRKTTNELWFDVFKRTGMTTEESSQVLNLTLNLIRGMAVNRMWNADERYYDLCIHQWVTLITSQIKTRKQARRKTQPSSK